MATALYALGLVLVVEGLVWALAPGLIDQMLQVLRDLSPDARRVMGIGALALGIALIWLARSAAAI